ncbi:MAG TPA: ATP synthase F1 subunit delta [Pirellulaceae bacterium]|nr:ATP synthase F1 subunit delta [Pirellulaceae bacterium]
MARLIMERVTKIPTVFEATRQKVGEVYALALLRLGAQVGRASELLAELEAFVGVSQQLSSLTGLLESPRVPLAVKHQVIDRALEGRASREFKNFVKVLVDHGRTECLQATLHAARNLSDELAGEVRGVVTTAIEVDTVLQARLAEKIGQALGKKVVLRATQDPTIIGGVVVRVGDTVYDASVANQLKQIKARAVKSAADAIRQSLDRFATEA